MEYLVLRTELCLVYALTRYVCTSHWYEYSVMPLALEYCILRSTKLKNVSCENDLLNGWNSTFQAAWYIRHVRWACLLYTLVFHLQYEVLWYVLYSEYFTYNIMIWCLWTKPTISFTFFSGGRSRVSYILSSWRIQVGDSPGCCQGQQDDFP